MMTVSSTQKDNNESNPRHITAVSIIALSGGESQKLTLTSSSVQTLQITTGFVVVTPTVDCFFRQGINPVSLSDGTDQILQANNSYRIGRIVNGNIIAFITEGLTGTVYVSPGG